MGFVSSSVGIMPPGMLNMTAVKISLREGRTRALVFAAGAALIFAIQSYVAVLFARFLDQHPEIIIVLREAGVVLFLTLAVYFFFFAKPIDLKKKKIKFHSKRSRFFMGMLLSSLNFFTIPFYVFVSITLASYDVFHFEPLFIAIFVSGIALGSFFGFFCFIAFFQKMEHKTAAILNNMNGIIGSALLLASMATLWNILQYYYK